MCLVLVGIQQIDTHCKPEYGFETGVKSMYGIMWESCGHPYLALLILWDATSGCRY